MSGKYVYIKSEPRLWTTGFYENGKWYPDADYDCEEKAASRVHWLNGGNAEPAPVLPEELRKAITLLDRCIKLGLFKDWPNQRQMEGAISTLITAAREMQGEIEELQKRLANANLVH
jgi:hypothetical protein